MKPDTTHWNLQKGKKGLFFRYTTTIKGKEEEWIGGELKSDWYYVFKYEDNTMFGLHEDINGKIDKKLNETELKEIL